MKRKINSGGVLCTPLVKALEKGRLQPMYAKLREQGHPSRGQGLVSKLEICRPTNVGSGDSY